MTAAPLTALVVGCGIMGLSVAWALVRRGRRVTMIEQGSVPNLVGASVDRQRLIRYAYGDRAGYTAMVAEAYPLWERLWQDLGARHYVATGTLILQSGGDWGRKSAETLAAAGQPVAPMEPAAARQRWPMLRRHFAGEIYHTPTGGVLLAERIVRGLAAWLDARPEAELLTGTQAREIEADRRRIVLADGRRLSADCLVVAAGAWTAKLVPELAPTIVAARQVVGYFEPPAHLAAPWAAAPMLLDIGAGDAVYAVPPVRDTGLKLGRHAFGAVVDPDDVRTVTEADIAALRAAASPLIDGIADYPLTHTRACLYDVAAEERFIVRPLAAGTWVLGGFSGHGFKFAPAIGERVVAALCGDVDPAAVAPWAAARLTG